MRERHPGISEIRIEIRKVPIDELDVVAVDADGDSGMLADPDRLESQSLGLARII